MPLYIRHSCCIKITQFQTKLTPFIHLRHHYSTQLPITQNPAILYFISLFIVPIKIFQLFIPVTPLFRILLHNNNKNPRVKPVVFQIGVKPIVLATRKARRLLCVSRTTIFFWMGLLFLPSSFALSSYLLLIGSRYTLLSSLCSSLQYPHSTPYTKIRNVYILKINS